MCNMYTCLYSFSRYCKTGRAVSLLVAAGLFIAACASGPSRPFAPMDPANSSSVEELTIPPEFRTASIPTSGVVGQMGKTGVINDPGSETSFEKENTVTQVSPPALDTIEPSAAPLGNVQQMNLDERIANLEKHYRAFYNDFYAIYPSLKSLTAIEKDMQELVRELSYLADKDKSTPDVEPVEPRTEPHVQNDGTEIKRSMSPDPIEMAMSANERPVDITSLQKDDTPTMDKPEETIVLTKPPVEQPPSAPTKSVEAPKPAPKAEPANIPVVKKQTEKTAEQAVQSGTFLSAVKRVRIGEHPGKKRFVIDFIPGSIIDYTKTDENGKVTISLGDTMWKGRTSWKSSYSSNPLQGYNVSKTATGSILTIDLNSSASVQKIFDLPPENASIGPKLIIDIAG